MGLPWACLQSVGWVKMVVSYSRHTSLMEAVSMTFDGRHPCKICKAVNQHEKETGQSVAKAEKKKFSWTILSTDSFIPVTVILSMVPEPCFSIEKTWGAPPTPPPEPGS